MFNYSGKIVAVTGASSGLGQQVAEGYASAGANLVLLARRIDRLEASAREWSDKYGVEVLPIACDVTDEASISNAFARIDEKFGRLEVLFNAAGGEKGTGTPLPDFKKDDWDFTMNLDLTSIFSMNKYGAKYMEEKIESGKQSFGRIINVASIYGLVGNTAIPTIAYHASKGAVVNFTKAAAAELATKKITVNAICPGYFYTELTTATLDTEYFQNFAKNSVPMQRYGQQGELNSAAIFLGAEESSYVTGQILAVDGGYTAV